MLFIELFHINLICFWEYYVYLYKQVLKNKVLRKYSRPLTKGFEKS